MASRPSLLLSACCPQRRVRVLDHALNVVAQTRQCAQRTLRRSDRKDEPEQQQQTKPKPLRSCDAGSGRCRSVHSDQLESTIKYALAFSRPMQASNISVASVV